MIQKLKTTLVQLDAGPDRQKNIRTALRLVEEAARKKAKFILLPEVFNYRGPLGSAQIGEVAEKIPGPSLVPLAAMAAKYSCHILAGSVCEKISGSKKVYNTSALIGPKGKIEAVYRKINLFDAVLGRKTVKESNVFKSGHRRVICNVGGFKTGLSICYDLRFPELYRKYSAAGCQILTVPASFTRKTGEAHWEVLLRARAIENASFVLAPNQTGVDGKGVPTYGHSMIIDPWGQVLARAGRGSNQLVTAQLDMRAITDMRKVLPSLLKS